MNGHFEDIEDGVEPLEADFADEITLWEEDAPDIETLIAWEQQGGCEAIDGCWVEPDGVCPHGRPSWLLEMGLI